MTIRRDAGNVSEYYDFDLNAQATKPFIREHFRECSFAYDSVITPGDIVQDAVSSEDLMVMNVTPEILAQEIVSKSCVLYKCNVSGEIRRQSGERDATTYAWVESWPVIKSDAYGLLTMGLYGTDIDQKSEIGQIEVKDMSLYIPTRYGVQALDRYCPVSGEYYKIEAVEETRFPNIVVCQITEDTR